MSIVYYKWIYQVNYNVNVSQDNFNLFVKANSIEEAKKKAVKYLKFWNDRFDIQSITMLEVLN